MRKKTYYQIAIYTKDLKPLFLVLNPMNASNEIVNAITGGLEVILKDVIPAGCYLAFDELKNINGENNGKF